MPARGHVTDTKGRAHRAAELFLKARDEGDSLTREDVASRFGIAIGTLYNAVKKLRKERAATIGSAP